MGRYDSAWKDIIEAHFKEFVEFYFPDVSVEIDFSKPTEFLDKELQTLTPAGDGPGRIVDLLARVHSRNGTDVLLFCHVEVQGRKDHEFPKRLFQIGYRIFDRFDSVPITLVILTDPDPNWHPDVYEVIDSGRYWRVEFNVSKLIYYRERIPDLKRSGNPFAFVTEALLEESESIRLREETRYSLKKRLAYRLFGRGYDGDYIWSLFRFLDWILQLPEELERRLRENINKEWGGETMSYITSWEQIAEKKGRETGRREGREEGHLEDKQEVLIRLLARKFSLEDHERENIRQCTNLALLDTALDAIIFAETKDEVMQHLH